MIVDDDGDILMVMTKGLGQAGFNVHSFSNPISAIQHIESGCTEYEVLVSDVRMPQMTGFQLIRRARDLRPEIKTVLMTAFEMNMKEFQNIFPSSPVEGVIRKPFAPSKLAETIKEIYNVEKKKEENAN